MAIESVAVLGTGIMGAPIARNLARAVRGRFEKAADGGHADDDMAAVYEAWL